MEKKTFDRSVCFSFYESYLHQGKLVADQMGKDQAYDYFVGLIEYALYQKEPNDMMTKILVTGLYNTIDACQKKRANAFNGRDVDMDDAISKYVTENPNASQREIADAVNCSPAKVNKVLKEINKNNNNNNNTNTTSNNNSVNVNTNTPEKSFDKNERSKDKKRWLYELTDEELQSISEDYSRRVDYIKTKERLGLKYHVTKDTHTEAENILEERSKENRKGILQNKIAEANEKDLVSVCEFLNVDGNDELLIRMTELNVDIRYIVRWMEKYHDAEELRELHNENKAYYEKYDDFVAMMLEANKVEDEYSFFDI